jgi:hypothetical protein
MHARTGTRTRLNAFFFGADKQTNKRTTETAGSILCFGLAVRRAIARTRAGGRKSSSRAAGGTRRGYSQGALAGVLAGILAGVIAGGTRMGVLAGGTYAKVLGGSGADGAADGGRPSAGAVLAAAAQAGACETNTHAHTTAVACKANTQAHKDAGPNDGQRRRRDRWGPPGPKQTFDGAGGKAYLIVLQGVLTGTHGADGRL